ncbi:NADP-dependent oxidoreductase [Lacticaseibacillus hegangensis]|uniref:NADP-dependent oxidoreductase n=1 Tax=Lacticaseibacillus hegangensis TaxID=2486010 RepID=A0ABW4CXF9_9LACO|nr:NADP-dependent oxidoreductase [Lacticaseibacillus hegangensis]
MKAVQITKYSKSLAVQVNDVAKPTPAPHEVLIRVQYAAVNPVDLMNITGSVKLIQNYPMPLTLGNEIAGEVVARGAEATAFKVGDQVYARLPLGKIGGFAEYVAVAEDALWYVPKNLSLKQAVAVPLTGLTAYQGLTEELAAQPGRTLFIPGGSGSFGQMAVPIAKQMGLKVIVSGNAEAKARITQLGADQYLDYRKENYWEVLAPVDYIIDTRGAQEIEREVSVLKQGGRILSLVAGPNRYFATSRHLPFWKTFLFGIAGRRWDKLARSRDGQYRFLFVRSDGAQLKKVTEIVEDNNIVPTIDDHVFTLDQINEALQLVDHGKTKGKVVIEF